MTDKLKCAFCGAAKEQTNLLIAGQDESCSICDRCIEQASKLRDEELRIVPDKTARAISNDRSISLTFFKDSICLKINKFQKNNNLPEVVGQNLSLSFESFCVLAKLICQSMKEFEIDYEAIVSAHSCNKPVFTFNDLTK